MPMTYSQELTYNTSAECRADGVGCDGYHADRPHQECVCACHGHHAPDFVTNDDVLAWHISPDTHRIALPEDDTNDPRTDPIRDHKGRIWVLIPRFRQRG